MSVVEKSAGNTDKVAELCAISGQWTPVEGMWLGTLELKLNEVVPREEGTQPLPSYLRT